MTIAVVGKYIKHHDAYKSVYESLDHAGIATDARVVVRKIEAEEVEREGAERALGGVDGILVPGGFGDRGIEGKIEAIRFARETNIPFFGICLGLQCAIIEFARNVLKLGDANTTEFDRNCRHPGRLHAGRAVPHHRQGRHHAAGRLSVRTGRGEQGPRGLRQPAGR